MLWLPVGAMGAVGEGAEEKTPGSTALMLPLPQVFLLQSAPGLLL